MIKVQTPETDERWQAVVRKDAACDGSFYYAVKTTGVYCRPSCGARLPGRQNVEFHETCAAAEQAGFRPCKRCRPTDEPLRQVQAQKVADICRLLEQADPTPSLTELSKLSGMSPYYFHRLFKATTGVTPKSYAQAHRTKVMRRELLSSDSVTEAIFAAGFSSTSRFYETSNAVLGMTPSSFRRDGLNTIITFATGQCSLGSILVATTKVGVCAILLGDDTETLVSELRRRFAKAKLVGPDPALTQTLSTVVDFVDKPVHTLALPLDIAGTAFQQCVWRELQKIPPGKTATYSDIADALGSPNSVRAVATACAANPIAVAIPCHRIIAKDGSLAGYRWGLHRKRALLDKEQL